MLNSYRGKIPLKVKEAQSQNLPLTGFTLIELVIVIVILSILAVVGFSRGIDISSIRMSAGLGTLRSDLRYAQALAVKVKKTTRISFDLNADSYSLYIENSPGNWTNVVHPLTNNNYTVNFNADKFEGIELSLVSVDGLNRPLIFNQWGDPTIDGTNPITEDARFQISNQTSTNEIRVERGTGRVYLQ
ncbi:MAG: prepilin-type N-terminal cleavage/methylation domain-containing protein [Candidatus Omnitrophica bacterium]|nr:prepilin-type N-terminal cleavage/methylation domain-containing protein [Candidatus Omnitrophota bacterium]